MQNIVSGMEEVDAEKEQIKKIKNHKFKRYTPSTCVQKYSYLLIRPPRLLYNERILNPGLKYGRKYTHQIYHIPFDLSLYIPKKCRYVILYLHGNSSSRIQGYKHLAFLPADVGLACFDFNGCGLRTEQKYITLGKTQANDVDIAFRFLRQQGYLVAGWGRSMGAVSLLLSSECKVFILDSPFSSLKNVCKELAQSECPNALLCFFHCCFPCLFWMIGQDVKSKIGMDPAQLQILDHVKKMDDKRSIAFIAAKDDTTVNFNHSKLLFDNFKGKKTLVICEGTHNTIRPAAVNETVLQFIQSELFYDKQGESMPLQTSFVKRKSFHERQTQQSPVLQTYTNLISCNQLSNSVAERVQEHDSRVINVRPLYETARP